MHIQENSYDKWKRERRNKQMKQRLLLYGVVVLYFLAAWVAEI